MDGIAQSPALTDEEFEKMARETPVAAYDSDKERFIAFCQTLKKTATRQQIDDLIEWQRDTDEAKRLAEINKELDTQLAEKGLVRTKSGTIIKREDAVFNLRETKDGRLKAIDGTIYARDARGTLRRENKKARKA